ncbi:hypothetical protein KAR91_42515 [Candidatus Pacearchaeota archaeon]|nr:hypothetical protein [Candidatus Pacearchaeota archaeon]
MKKVDLLQALSVKFHKVETPNLVQTYGSLKYYQVKVYDVIGETIRDMNIPFYVENEGQAGESAYWSPAEPKPDPVGGFQNEVAAYITGKITDGTIEAAFAEQIDRVNKTAIYKVVMPDLTEKRIFVDKDNGNLRHRNMT